MAFSSVYFRRGHWKLKALKYSCSLMYHPPESAVTQACARKFDKDPGQLPKSNMDINMVKSSKAHPILPR